jgi:hypothetical protein
MSGVLDPVILELRKIADTVEAGRAAAAHAVISELEAEISELHKEVDELRAAVAHLRASDHHSVPTRLRPVVARALVRERTASQ